jgi:hypothetical protein
VFVREKASGAAGWNSWLQLTATYSPAPAGALATSSVRATAHRLHSLSQYRDLE